jgi:hypothetical protein
MTSKDKELLVDNIRVQCKIIDKVLRIEDTLTVQTANKIKEHAALVLESAAKLLRDDISN